MNIPDQIKLNCELEDPFSSPIRMQNGYLGEPTSISTMIVPEKIILMGNEKCIFDRAQPHEIEVQNALMPADPAISIQTPPRIITLNDETFKITEDDISEKITVKAKNQSRTEIRDIGVNVTRKDSLTRSQSMASLSGVSDTTEEIDNLRRQISRMNRRLMTLELENQHRQNREFVMYTLGFGYFLLKALLWLSRKN
ncbi:transport and Golgi organization protein 11-like [Artemia franciscana]|uniref:Mitochondrial fission factor n=1 Tax=Artemia franciscana TaxID=6661 RepID=A0AA88I469_ARTSF|nr:hypothetical protein QYM36_003545 [Artemia franciscana]KAK2721295.1 hypothetical protein QYM36_003545 [Artemia franciscana]